MMGFINFLIMLVWALFKLFLSMILCCVAFLFFMWLMRSMPILVKRTWDSSMWAWDEIRIMENNEYGETEWQTKN
ncbi:MAG: hypothetical protein IKU47_08065 [Oscillospiraceae bacterium]|nr:hypothetical protein [Oscillospiraceae bacterium]